MHLYIRKRYDLSITNNFTIKCEYVVGYTMGLAQDCVNRMHY